MRYGADGGAGHLPKELVPSADICSWDFGIRCILSSSNCNYESDSAIDRNDGVGFRYQS